MHLSPIFSQLHNFKLFFTYYKGWIHWDCSLSSQKGTVYSHYYRDDDEMQNDAPVEDEIESEDEIASEDEISEIEKILEESTELVELSEE